VRAWTFQDSRQKRKLGEKKCPWSVGWIDPDGIRRSKKIGSESMAEKFKRKKEGQLAAGTYQSESRKQWADFRREYEERIADGLEPKTRKEILNALNHFDRLASPNWLHVIKTQTIDGYVTHRRGERGLKRSSVVSPATINKELRHIKAALRVAQDWGYLTVVPKVRMLKEPKKLPRYVTPEHFAEIYEACKVAVRPKGQHYQPADWWRAFLTFQYMTGWRLGEPLALRWDDVSLDKATAITCYDDNKGDRDDLVPLHPVVVDHLRRIADFGLLVFPWPHGESTIWKDFARIQEAAGIHLPCREKHEHTPACHFYGFHDLRRAFATQNAERLSGDALQALMRHKSYSTTQRYINMARQVNRAVEKLHVPEILRVKAS
jgi:integrase